jgi:outer membrane protein TolC
MNVRHSFSRRQPHKRLPGQEASIKEMFLAAIMAALAAASAARGAEVKRLTLAAAVDLALKQNRALKIARLQVQENQEDKASAKSLYFPTLHNDTSFVHLTAFSNIEIPADSFGRIPGVGALPPHDILVDQGAQTGETSGTSLTEPLTQLLRIRQKNRVAQANVATSRSEVRKSELDVALEVHQMYYALLVAQLNRQAAQQQIQYTEENLRESAEGVTNGSELKVSEIGSQAGLLQSKQTLLTVELQLVDLSTQFNDMLGLPLDTKLELDPDVRTDVPIPNKQQCLQMAWEKNPDIRSAELAVQKAGAGVGAARTKYIPNVSVFARYSYQNGIPFLVHNFGTFGVTMSYDIFDFGRRRDEVRKQVAQLREAEENLERLRDDTAVQVDQTYDKLLRTKQMVEVAQQLVTLRTEGERLASNQLQQGATLISERRKASAESYQAHADLLQASLAYVLTRAELDRTIGVDSQF